MTLKVAIISRDADVRAAAARVFAAAPGTWSIALCHDDPGDADVVVRGADAGPGPGIVFDETRPGDALTAVAAAGGAARTYLVTGAVGGAGATSIALHLAAALGDRACYAELTRGPDRLGLPPDARTWLPRDDDLAASALPVAGGFRVLRAPRPCPPPEAFPLGAARSAFPRLVLDVGTRRQLGDLCRVTDATVVVATPTRPAALEARGLLQELADVPSIVVVNRLGPGGQIMRTALEGLLGRPAAVDLPCCAALRDAEDEGRLLRGTWRRWTRGVAALARALEGC